MSLLGHQNAEGPTSAIQVVRNGRGAGANRGKAASGKENGGQKKKKKRATRAIGKFHAAAYDALTVTDKTSRQTYRWVPRNDGRNPRNSYECGQGLRAVGRVHEDRHRYLVAREPR